ncbi:MAG: LptA/OstA family protein [Thermodesulfobacteriota bacterium]|jgi:lipopolysaccharide export system protein LptA
MSGRTKKLGGVLLVALLTCYLFSAAAAEEKTSPGRSPEASSGDSVVDAFSLTSRKEPIDIRANGLEFLYDEKRIVYRGDVIAKQGESTLKSDVLTVIYEEAAPNVTPAARAAGGTASRQQLKEIIAEGNVEITSGDRRATGQKAVFNETTRTVVLSGNALLQEGPNQVSGERVTIFLDEKRSVVDGDARMTIVPEQKGQKK